MPGGRKRVAPRDIPSDANQVPVNTFYLMFDNRKIPLVHQETLIGRNGNLMVNIDHASVAVKHAVILLKNFEGETMPTIE